MSKLILHIGLKKTGSSAIQVFLSRNRNALKKNNIHYPESDNDKRAEKGEITSGNGIYLSKILCEKDPFYFFNTPKHLIRDNLIQLLKTHKNENILYSSEFLSQFGNLQLMELATLCRTFNKDLHIVCYVRHIADHLFSLYQQKIKRHCYSKSFTCFLKETPEDETMQHVTLNKLYDCKNALTFDIRLYDNVKHRLCQDFLSAIGVTDNTKFDLNIETVNRSLTKNEIATLSAINKHTNNVAVTSYISDKLIYMNPTSAPLKTITPDAFEIINQQYPSIVSKLNQKLQLSTPLRLISDNLHIANETPCQTDSIELLAPIICEIVEKEIHQTNSGPRSRGPHHTRWGIIKGEKRHYPP